MLHHPISGHQNAEQYSGTGTEGRLIFGLEVLTIGMMSQSQERFFGRALLHKPCEPEREILRLF